MDDMIQYDFCKPYLMVDEYILWKGKPEKGHLITGNDVIVSLFGIVWLFFCLNFIRAIFMQPTLFLIIWMIPFVCVGFYMAFGKIIQKIYLRNKTFYVITNKKLMI